MKRIPVDADEVGPNGSHVRVLLSLQRGLMAVYELAPGQTSKALTYRTVEEIWLFISGRGLLWRKHNNREEVVPVEQGVCVTIPLGTHFQFRSLGDGPLVAVGVTMPPFAGRDEAIVVRPYWEQS